MPPKPLPPVGPMPPVVAARRRPLNIPLRYYGFVKPSWRGDGNRGYFMEGENISYGHRRRCFGMHFLVVALSPNKARVEDIQTQTGPGFTVNTRGNCTMIHTSARRRTRQKGSAFLIVFVFAAMLAIMLYKEMPVVAFEAQRQKEQLLD